jgi:anti-sigma B factor antagonist
MRIRDQHTGRAIVELTGRIDATAVHAQRATLLSMLDGGTNRIVVDLSRTQFLDSAAMAMLVSLMKRARQAGGDVRVVEPADESVRRILRLTRLDLVLNLRSSCDAALEGL